MRRVAITGLGTVCPAGTTTADAWDAIVSGRSAVSPIEGLPMRKLTCTIAAQVKGWDATAHLPSRQAGMMDRISQFAVVAARQAVEDSGIVLDDALKSKAQVIVGVGVGGLNTLDDSFRSIYADDKNRVHPLTIPRLMTNAPASQVSMDLGLRGTTYAIASACASATHAIGVAFHAIRRGDTTIAVTGGAEACITVGTLLGWEALRVMSYDTCRPFSKDRSGLILGEGAAMLVLEDLEQAQARGARIYAEIVGFGSNADAGDLTTPDPKGAEGAMRLALEDAGLDAAQVGYVNAHGTGTAINDRIESGAIRTVFPEDALPLVSSIKGVVGHSLGAAGAIEAVATALTLHHQIIPPTANHTETDPEIGLDVVPNEPRSLALDYALSNSFAFGGLNAVLAFRRHG